MSKGLATAALVVFVALTPSVAEGLELWERETNRPYLLAWYVTFIVLAGLYWKQLQ
jgi:hypothetical protein